MKIARRFLVLLTAAGLSASGGRTEEVAVRLKETGRGVYELEGSFLAGAPRSEAWAVLADYDRIDEFVPSVTESRLLHRGPKRALIEQRIEGRAFFFSRQMELTLQVEEDFARSISFNDVGRGDFRSYAGEWGLEDSTGGTTVTYRLRASPRFRAPDFLARGAFKRGVRELLEGIRREIQRRAGKGGRS